MSWRDTACGELVQSCFLSNDRGAAHNPSSAELGMRNAERALRGKGLAQRRRDAEDEMKARRRGEREQSVVSNRQSAVRPLRGKRDRRFTT